MLTNSYESYPDLSGLAGYSLSLRLRRIQLPQRGSLPSLSLRDISPRGRDKFGLFVRGSLPSLSLRDISPGGRDKLAGTRDEI